MTTTQPTNESKTMTNEQAAMMRTASKMTDSRLADQVNKSKAVVNDWLLVLLDEVDLRCARQENLESGREYDSRLGAGYGG